MKNREIVENVISFVVQRITEHNICHTFILSGSLSELDNFPRTIWRRVGLEDRDKDRDELKALNLCWFPCKSQNNANVLLGHLFQA